MPDKNFIIVGENIHCTRTVKSGGIRTTKISDKREGVKYTKNGEEKVLPLPENWEEISPKYRDGAICHITLAIHQATLGKTEPERKAGEEYLEWVAQNQIEHGAHYLDVNVDEYSIRREEQIEAMKWTVDFLSKRFDTPIAIDSSVIETLSAGLETCSNGKTPMINSISLEREDAVDLAIQYSAHAIVSAAGRTGLPQTAEEKIKNLEEIVTILDRRNIPREKMHLDPLVLPISVDSTNGKHFLDSVKMARERFEGVNITGGLSNVSFGMPNRKLLNLVFTWMFIQAGGNGGIIDPVRLSIDKITTVNTETESFKLAKAVLDGTDMFGAEYIAAFREGRI